MSKAARWLLYKIMALRFGLHVVRNHFDRYKFLSCQPELQSHQHILTMARENPCCARYMPKGWEKLAW